MAKKKAASGSSKKNAAAKESTAKKRSKKSAKRKAVPSRSGTAVKKAAANKVAKRAARKKASGGDATSLDALKTKLQSLLEKPDSEKKVIRLLAPLGDVKRQSLAPLCRNWLKKQRKNDFIEDPPGTFRPNPLLNTAEVAMFCVASLSEIKRQGQNSLPRGPYLIEILKLRKPKWADQIAVMLLETSYYWGSWRTVREMVRLKLCSKPDHVRYYTGMISGLCGARWGQKLRTALQELREDPALLKEEVWRLFEYEGEGENTLANVDRWDATGWSEALITLSKEGRLSRARLLASALGTLELGFNHYRARWFFTFIDRLDPTDRELRKHADTILDLVGSPTPNVAAWAFGRTEQIWKQGLVKDVARLTDAVRPLLMAKQKGTVQKALKFLDRLAQNSPQSAGEICLAATDALSHEKVDIQKAAFQLISKYATEPEEELAAAIQKSLPLVAPSFQPQLSDWLSPDETETTAEPPEKKTRAGRTGGGSAITRSQLEKYSSSHRALMRIDELADSLDAGTTPLTGIPAVTFNGTEFPRLDPVRRVAPIENLEELIEVCGRVLEDSSLIDDGERALDGLSRLAGNRPDDFSELIGPLRKRATTLITKRRKVPFAGESLTCDLCGLICVWANGGPPEIRYGKNDFGNPQIEIHGVLDEAISTWQATLQPLTFLSFRSFELAGRLEDPAPLLSAPTHEGGWIDPAEWVRRLNSLTSDPGEADLILSLLRLAPDGKAAALKSLKPKLKGEWASVATYALGGTARIGKSGPLWIAAARSRTPFGNDSRVSKAFPNLGASCGDSPRYRVRHYTEEYHGKTLPRVSLDSVTGPPKKRNVLIPTQLLHLNRMENSLSFWDIGIEPGSINWVETMWPLERDSFFAAGAQCLVENIDWWEAAWHNRCFLNPLLDPDTPPGEIGMFLLLCGLGAKEPGEHGLAADITIRGITDGRIGTDNLRDTIAQHAPSNVFKLARLAARFQDVAATSDLHAFVIMHAWEQALSEEFNHNPRGLGDVLELLCELGAQLNRGIESESCRAYLADFSGSSKTAKAAKLLLNLPSSCSAADFASMAISHRVSRLEDWASR